MHASLILFWHSNKYNGKFSFNQERNTQLSIATVAE